MKRMISLITTFTLVFILFSGNIVVANQSTPLLTYKGKNGVEIRSYVPDYGLEKLKWIYEEFAKNTMGEEVKYLSHINLYPDYSKGINTAGMWHGEWANKKLTPGRYIDLFGVSDDNPHILVTLAHEYGHHFIYYYLNKKDEITNNFLSSEYTAIRNLKQYEQLEKGDHSWSISEIAAEDYAQLFGSPTLAQIKTFQFNPQENAQIPLAWDVPGLYEYFVKLSGQKGKTDHKAPTKPFLQFTGVTNDELIFKWEKCEDDSGEPLNYSIVGIPSPAENSQIIYLMNPTNKGGTYTSALNRKQLRGDNIDNIVVKLIVMDSSGNAVSSEIPIDLNNPENSLTYIFRGKRIAGDDRYQTSAAISQAGFPKGSSYAFLVTGENFPDALSAAPLAKKYNAPILLTPAKALNPAIEAEILRLGAKNIIIIGGTGAVSQGIENSLKAKEMNVRRIEGASRYETSLAIAKELGDFSEAFICTGENFPDALSAAAVAASKEIPILLTPMNRLPEGLSKFIESRDLTMAYVVGGTGVVSNSVFNQIPHAKRLEGNNRYETNLAILNEFSSTLNDSIVYLATGVNYPDALSGSIIAAQMKSPIILTGNDGVATAKSYLIPKGLGEQKVQVIGGSGVVTDSLLKKIFVD